MKKVLAWILVAAMAMSILTACGGTAEPQSSTGSANTPSGNGSLVIWVEKSFSEEVDKLIDERIQEFGERNGVEVKAEFIAATDYMTKLNAAVEAGNVPDLTLANPYKVVSYFPSNPYSDVTELVEEIDAQRPMIPSLKEGTQIEGVNYFVPFYAASSLLFLRKDLFDAKGIAIPTTWEELWDAAKEGTQIEGVNYFVPFYAASSLLFLRKDLFDAKGIAIPTTWEELWDAAVAVSDPENGIYGLGMGCGPTDEDCENSFRMMLWDLGGRLMDEQGNIVAGNDAGLSTMIDKYVGCGPTDEDCENSFRMMLWDLGGRLMDEQGNIVAGNDAGLSTMIDKYVELYEAGAIPPAAITWDPGGNNKSYLMGESAMVINVPTLYNAIKNDEQYAQLYENTVVLNLPAGTADDAVFGNPSGWAIMKDGKNPENAKAFIKFVSEKEWYDGYMDAIAPVFAPVYEDLVDSETWSDGVNQQAIEYVQNATGYYGYPCQTLEGRAIASKNYYSFPVARMLNSVVTGTATKEEAMAKLETELRDTAAAVTGG